MSQMFSHDGPTLAFDIHGPDDAPTVALLHGLSSSRATWDRVRDDLAADHRVITYDHRGHGESERAPDGDAYRVGDYGSDAAALIANLCDGPVPVVGWSLGGLTAAWLATERPDVVSRVFLEDPPIYFGERVVFDSSMFALMFPMLADALDAIDAAGSGVEGILEVLGAVPDPSGAGSMAEVMGPVNARRLAESWNAFDQRALAPAIDCTLTSGFDPAKPSSVPVRILRAERDLGAAFFPEHVDRYLAANPDATIDLVPGASHTIHDEQHDLVLEEIRTFLAAA